MAAAKLKAAMDSVSFRLSLTVGLFVGITNEGGGGIDGPLGARPNEISCLPSGFTRRVVFG